MSHHQLQTLDPRTWLIWALVAMLPLLTGRNPWPLLVVALCVFGVRRSAATILGSSDLQPAIVKLAAFFAGIGVIFNVLTVRSGNIILVAIPERFPILGGDLTLNSVVYGLLGGAALVTLVVTGITVAALIDKAMLLRLTPEALLGLGASASVALTFFPQAVASFHEIREARRVRGLAVHGVSAYASLAAPLLNAGLERAVGLSELLESRGFGSGTARSEQSVFRSAAIVAGLVAMCATVFAFAVGRTREAAIGAVLIGICLLSLFQTAPRGAIRRTRFREPQFVTADFLVIAGAVIAFIGTIVALAGSPESLQYDPYPNLTIPYADPALLAALCGLVMPALLLGQARK